VVGESLKPDSANFFEARRTLTAGSHPIQLDFFQRGGGKQSIPAGSRPVSARP